MGSFLEVIELQNENSTGFSQKIVFEWWPIVCYHCRKFGHSKQDCGLMKKQKSVWKFKDKHSQDKRGRGACGVWSLCCKY